MSEIDHRSGDCARSDTSRRARSLRQFVFLVLLGVTPAAFGVLSGADWEAKASRDPDLSAATAAIDEERWNDAVASLERFIERRPWDDDGYTLLGYAHRKLGDYEHALEYYQQALKLNPYHLGAMEYLGEAYLELGRPDSARALLMEMETTCRRTLGDARWRDECEEYRELAERIETGN